MHKTVKGVEYHARAITISYKTGLERHLRTFDVDLGNRAEPAGIGIRSCVVRY
jgi:hypothetical protein